MKIVVMIIGVAMGFMAACAAPGSSADNGNHDPKDVRVQTYEGDKQHCLVFTHDVNMGNAGGASIAVSCRWNDPR